MQPACWLKLTGSEHGGGEAEVLDKAASLATYVDVYSTMGYVTAGDRPVPDGAEPADQQAVPRHPIGMRACPTPR
jgi:hypothetical protein